MEPPKKRQAVFIDTDKNPTNRRAWSAVPSSLYRSTQKKEAQSNGRLSRRQSSIGAIRVAHSILHPLTDPEKAQLQLKEIERLAQEHEREKARKLRHRYAQGKFTLMERLTGKAKQHRECFPLIHWTS